MLRAIVTKVCAMLGRAVYGLAPDRLAAAVLVPTIEMAALPNGPTVPTDARPTPTVGTALGLGMTPTSTDFVPTFVVGTPADHSRFEHGPLPLVPEQAAAAFFDWLRTFGLDDRPWAVDDVWYLASADFAPASEVALPPRNRFLGALQRLDGVRVQYDKRVRIGDRKVKTTVYTFAPVALATVGGSSNTLERRVFERAA